MNNAGTNNEIRLHDSAFPKMGSTSLNYAQLSSCKPQKAKSWEPRDCSSSVCHIVPAPMAKVLAPLILPRLLLIPTFHLTLCIVSQAFHSNYYLDVCIRCTGVGLLIGLHPSPFVLKHLKKLIFHLVCIFPSTGTYSECLTTKNNNKRIKRVDGKTEAVATSNDFTV